MHAWAFKNAAAISAHFIRTQNSSGNNGSFSVVSGNHDQCNDIVFFITHHLRIYTAHLQQYTAAVTTQHYILYA